MPDLRRPRDLARILDDAFGLYRAHARVFLAIALAVVVPVDLIVLGGGLGWLWSPYERDTTLRDLLVPSLAQWLVVTPLVTAMTAYALRDAADGRAPEAGPAIQRGLDAFAPLLVAMVLVGAGLALGLIAFVIPAVVLAVHWALVPQVVALEGARGRGALGRSAALVRGSAWWTLGVLLVINLLAGVLSLVFTLPADLLAKAVDAQAVALAGTVLGHLVSFPFVALAGTLLYFALLARGDGAPPAPPAGRTPEQEAWARREAQGWAPPTPPAPGPERSS